VPSSINLVHVNVLFTFERTSSPTQNYNILREKYNKIRNNFRKQAEFTRASDIKNKENHIKIAISNLGGYVLTFHIRTGTSNKYPFNFEV
jgi:hypothetical protein